MVAHQDGGALGRDVVEPAQVEAHPWEQLGLGEHEQNLLRFDAHELGHAGGHVEVDDRPAPDRRHAQHAGVGVHHGGVADDAQQRGVVPAVGVGIARQQVDVVVEHPLRDGPGLAPSPHELPVDRAVVAAVLGAVAGGDDVVEAQAVGERSDQIRRGRGGHDQQAPRGPVLVDELTCVREHGVGQRFSRPPGGLSDCVDGPASRHPRSLPADQHGRVGLADQVEHLEHDRLDALRGARHHSRAAQRLAQDRTAGTDQQRAIEIEDGRGAAVRRSAARRRLGGLHAVEPIGPAGVVGWRITPSSGGKRLKDWPGGASPSAVPLRSGGGMDRGAEPSGTGGMSSDLGRSW